MIGLVAIGVPLSVRVGLPRGDWIVCGGLIYCRAPVRRGGRVTLCTLLQASALHRHRRQVLRLATREQHPTFRLPREDEGIRLTVLHRVRERRSDRRER